MTTPSRPFLVLIAILFLAATALRAADEAPAAAPDKASAAAATTPPATPPPTFWTQPTLTGDWWGYRTKLGDAGFSPFASWTGEIWGNVQGGIRNGMTQDMLFSAGFDADFQKMVGWTGGSAHVEMHWEQGQDPSNNTGSFTNPSSFVSTNVVRLYSIYLEQKLLADQLKLRAGQFGADQDFFQLNSAGLFLNSAMTAPPSLYSQLLFGGDQATAEYPLAAPAVWAKFKPTELPVYVQLGLYNGDPGPDDSNNHGFGWKTGNGLFVIGEAGYRFSVFSLPGSLIKAGAYYHSGEFVDWNTGNPEHGLYGGYLAFEQAILDQPASGDGSGDSGFSANADGRDPILTFFALGGWSGPNSLTIPQNTFSAGLNWHGPIPGRDSDIAGIAVLYTGFSSDFTAGTGGFSTASETVLEATYQAQITPWFTVQPDAQFIFNPAFSGTRQTAVVVGARAVVTF